MHNESAGVNTILLVLLLLIVVGGFFFWYFRNAAQVSTPQNDSIDISVDLPKDVVPGNTTQKDEEESTNTQ